MGDSFAMFMFEPGYKDFDPTKEEKRDRPLTYPPPTTTPTTTTERWGARSPQRMTSSLRSRRPRKILDEFGEVHHNLGLNQKGNRGLCAVGPIKNGEMALGIPECICYTAAGALKDERIGPFIDAHTAPSKPNAIPTAMTTAAGRSRARARPRPSSACPEGTWLTMRVTFDALHAIHDPVQHVGAVPLAPDREDFDESPTWWDDATREKLLKGSHVLELARKAAEDFEHDWNVVKDELADRRSRLSSIH